MAETGVRSSWLATAISSPFIRSTFFSSVMSLSMAMTPVPSGKCTTEEDTSTSSTPPPLPLTWASYC